MGNASEHFVVLAGNIGAGKTSLAEHLASQLGWTVGYEVVSRNAYLSDFYHEPQRWAFNLAMHNLELRLQQHLELEQNGKNVILDRSIYEDRYVFVEMQRESGLMSERDYRCYIAFWELLCEKMTTPDALVYIHVPVNALLDRIRERGRDIEQGITAEYLGALESKYESWIKSFNVCPVISLDGSTWDVLSEAGQQLMKTLRI